MPIIISIFSTFSTIILTLISKGIMNINAKQNLQEISLEGIKVDLINIKEKVNSLHEFRNKLQEQTLNELKEQLKQKDYV